jgi:RHS repeat-associated protein
LEYTYDSQSRRIAKRVLRKTHELGDWSLHQHRMFLYDGWNMIAEIDISIASGTARLHRSYAWGLDASGTRTGAGGVGGLLLTTHYVTPGSGTSSNVTLAPLYDLNANVLAYAEVTTSTITHRIDYDPFGNELTLDTLLPTAAAEEAPRFRFSTKYTDSESGLVYYGFRSYSPELGRWVNRDPIEERGGVNLYGMVGNDVVNRWDVLGQIFPFSQEHGTGSPGSWGAGTTMDPNSIQTYDRQGICIHKVDISGFSRFCCEERCGFES